MPRSLLFLALSLFLLTRLPAADPKPVAAEKLYARENLIAWCIVPFDSQKRGPEARAAMLEKLGFRHFAYDWRAEHLDTFDAEIAALKKHGVSLDAFWFPADLNAEARKILDVLGKHKIPAQLWVTMGDPLPKGDQETKVSVASKKIAAIAAEAAKFGGSVGLYNHGGWFGEPENQVAIIKKLNLPNVGIVYNLHHGHDHLGRIPELLKLMKPYLYAFNLNGMVKQGDRINKKILPLGAGDNDLELLQMVAASGYHGPIGILGHTSDDAEQRLQDNLDGLDWLLPQLKGAKPGPLPHYRTHKMDPPKGAKPVPPQVSLLLSEAMKRGDVRRGADVFRSAKFACLSCHKVGEQGGTVGPDLTVIATCQTPEYLVESLLFPNKVIREGYAAFSVTTTDGKTLQGYLEKEDAASLTLKDPATNKLTRLVKADIEARKSLGSLMPEGLVQAMTAEEQRDLARFILELGKSGPETAALIAHGHTPAAFPYVKPPLHPEQWPNWTKKINRDRLYEYYVKQSEYFQKQKVTPLLLPAFPGLDGGTQGHWGNQNEASWGDLRWNDTILGSVQAGIFRSGNLTIPRAVCLQLGDKHELHACFNPETLTYEALWKGDFLKFSGVRHGFMDGVRPGGTMLPRPENKAPTQPFEYHGFYRHGNRVVFSYRIGDVEYLDSPWVENGQFTRTVAPAKDHPLKKLTEGGSPQWPQKIEVRGQLGKGSPYAIDTIPLPLDNPWKALCFFGDHDFLPDGSALVCTMEGDVWHVSGLDAGLEKVTWRRFASGLHHCLGLVVVDGVAHVLGRDQITRLHDLNQDGEADYYERFSAAYVTSPAGHDFICGLQRDSQGRFYTASGNQGLIRISADGKKADVLATGFRNPDGLGLMPDGALTVPCSEGDWTPASMICLVKPESSTKPRIGGHKPGYFGFGGPKNGQAPDLPLVYLPRGLDNSSGGQTVITGNRWGPLDGLAVHTSFGSGTHFLLLRDEVNGQPQGAVVPMPGDFNAGTHRARFNPKDGQLYVSGMAGWGTYTPDDGCFQRVRYTGAPVQLPKAWHAYENGVVVTFTQPLDPAIAGKKENHFVQAWNYLYSPGYGSAEFSPRHPGTIGHDPLPVASVHLLPDGRSLFLELPDLQPVNQLQLRLQPDASPAINLFATVHELAGPFKDYPGYQPRAKTIAAHPILSNIAMMAKAVPNPFRQPIPNARLVPIAADKNLSYNKRTLKVKAGEAIRLTFTNPDVVPHNWVLVKPGTLSKVGNAANLLVADPEAVSRQYVPKSEDVLFYTDIVPAEQRMNIFFHAPKEKGKYPFLCTFPGHWMVMNGELEVE